MADNDEKTHVITALVENEFGVLARVANLFAARSFNIESLTVGPTHDATISRMSIVVRGPVLMIDQVEKQLLKLVEVIAVRDLSHSGPYIARELMFVKLNCAADNRVELLKIGELFSAEAVDYTPGSLTFQVVGPPEKCDNFLAFLEQYEITEVARSGVVALNRGSGGAQTDVQAEQEALHR